MPNTFLRRPILMLALLLVLPAESIGQERRQGPGAPPYDVAKETTVKGAIVRSYTIPAGPERELQVLAVTIDGRAMQLILGPPDAVKKQAFDFIAGAAVEITGISGYQVNGEPAMLTRKVTSGKRTLILRDEAGKPTWETLR